MNVQFQDTEVNEGAAEVAEAEPPTPASQEPLTKTSNFKNCTATVHIDDLIRFLFPVNLQHSLVAGRLIVFGLYGPLDEHLQLRTGPQKRNVVSDWQLDLMCVQVEREDLLSIYLHKQSDVALLSSDEQESIISQADKHLKSAKGSAMLPPLTRDDVRAMFKHIPEDEVGMKDFNKVQAAILKFRADRIANYKRVFPKLSIEDSAEGGGVHNKVLTTTRRRTRPKKRGKVSAAVAPSTMFMHMKGSNNADIISTTNRYLNQYASQITDIDAGNSGTAATANVRLLREVGPRCPNPYAKPDGSLKRTDWNSTSQLTQTGLGSMVKAAASSSTWKRNTTLAEK